MIKLRYITMLVCAFVLAETTHAKMWYLPDYQGASLKRKNIHSGSSSNLQNGIRFKCNNYGLKALSDIGSEFECINTISAPEGCCAAWQCKKSIYPYSSANCAQNGQILGGESCNDPSGTVFYQNCLCDKSIYKYDSSNCQGQLAGNSCYDNGEYYSECITDACQIQANIVQHISCGNFQCKTTHSQCSTICTECYSDYCSPLIDSGSCKNCDICQTYASNCDSCCIECGTCSFTGYTLDNCPANTLCTPKTCGGTTKYMATGCSANYTDYNSQWCKSGSPISPVTDCATLGYSSSVTSCSGDYVKLSCPFNKSYAVCVQSM